MDIALAALICLLGGVVAGLIGVGGGIVFVPAMTVLLSKGQVEAQATSLLMIALVSIAGTWRQTRYGNVSLRDAAWIGLLSPVGVLAGVLLSNAVPERVLRIGFALLALYMAWRLLKRVFAPDDPDPGPGSAAGEESAAPGGTSPAGTAGLRPDGTGSAGPRATGPAGG